MFPLELDTKLQTKEAGCFIWSLRKGAIFTKWIRLKTVVECIVWKKI
jgi:hypothetical protein